MIGPAAAVGRGDAGQDPPRPLPAAARPRRPPHRRQPRRARAPLQQAENVARDRDVATQVLRKHLSCYQVIILPLMFYPKYPSTYYAYIAIYLYPVSCGLEISKHFFKV